MLPEVISIHTVHQTSKSRKVDDLLCDRNIVPVMKYPFHVVPIRFVLVQRQLRNKQLPSSA